MEDERQCTDWGEESNQRVNKKMAMNIENFQENYRLTLKVHFIYMNIYYKQLHWFVERAASLY